MKNSPRCKFDTGMTLRFHTVFTWMDTSFRPTWLWRSGDAILAWISKTVHALPVLDSQESYFMLERTAVPRLHDIGMSFRTGVKISPQYSYRGELAPVWLAPVQDFVLVSCKRIQSHKRELEWTRTGMKVALVSCKHPLRRVKMMVWSKNPNFSDSKHALVLSIQNGCHVLSPVSDIKA